MSRAAIIVAAGRGLRLGGPVPKQYRTLGDKAVLAHTLEAALAAPGVARVLVAIGADAGPLYAAAVAGIDDRRLMAPVTGGAERADTVRLALEALADVQPATVLVHDAARPFASPALWEAVAAAVEPGTPGVGAIAAEAVVDALWSGDGTWADAPRPRAGLWRAQTPQGFPFAGLRAAHAAEAVARRADPDRAPALDDAEVFRRAGGKVRLVAGEPGNFKITTPADLDRATGWVARDRGRAMEIRVGQGFDVHQFCPGDHVTLCGVRIAHDRGLLGHSDADVGLHALCDALYGALGAGDIGAHFPPGDPQWRGAESALFLAHAGGLVAARGGRIGNVDVTLLAEAPRILPHAAAMRERIGAILDLDPGRIGIKATTMETMGFVGRGEGMAALATATVMLGAW